MKSACLLIALQLALVRCFAEGVSTNNISAEITEPAQPSWSFSGSAYTYLVPDSRDYVNLNATADHNWLHLEGRYNYESLETGSLWIGYNLSFGEKLQFEVTPMLGGVFGNLTGVAPGYLFTISYKGFALSTQGEYFIDAEDSSGNFFYTWSELTYSPWDWFRAGLAIQRTKLYETELDIQRGFMVGVTYKKIDLAAYVFNVGWTDPTIVLAVAVYF